MAPYSPIRMPIKWADAPWLDKSSALLAILAAKIMLENHSRRKQQQKKVGETASDESDPILFK